MIFSNALPLKIYVQAQASSCSWDKVKQGCDEDNGTSKSGGVVPRQIPQEALKRAQSPWKWVRLKTTGRMFGPIPDLHLRYLPLYSRFLSETRCSTELRHTCTAKKPPVPARTDKPTMGIRTKRNFIRTATAVTMQPKPTCVDTSKGHKQLLENSGLVPKYINKKVGCFFFFFPSILHTNV